MAFKTIIAGSYAVEIYQRNDGAGFDLYTLYNVEGGSTRGSTVWERKTYKTLKMAEKRAAAYFELQGQV